MKTVHLFVFDTLSDWEPGFAIAGINNPQFQRRPGEYRVRTVSVSGKAVTTVGGLRIQPDDALEALDPRDSAMLILPGGARWDEGGNIEAIEHARAHLSAGVPVAAICGATAGLARGGLLDDRKHTSNAREYLAQTGYAGGRLYRDERVVRDGDLITASAMAPLDFARAIFECLQLYTPEVLDAWYKLFATGRPEYFGALMAASQSASAADLENQDPAHRDNRRHESRSSLN
jgi:putative intracellular protease/amidase